VIVVLGFILAASVIGVWVWFAREVGEGETLVFDTTIREALHSIASPWLTSLMKLVSFLGAPVTDTIVVVICLGAFLLKGKYRFAALLLGTMLGEVILDLILKEAYARVRPEAYFNYPLPTSFSFPSGHALGSMCLYGCLCWLLKLSGAEKWKVATFGAGALLFVLLIGISRIYLGVHYPTDIIAGYLAGAIWLTTVIVAEKILRSKKKATSQKPAP